MVRSPRRQVTPPQWRVWSYGLAGTTISAALTYGWTYLCVQVWSWPIQLPRYLNSADLVDASYVRVVGATVVVGLIACCGAAILARSVIGPRIWWLIISLGVGLTSLYGVLTLPGTDLAVRLRLVVLHVLVMVALVPTVGAALRISDADLAKLVDRHQASRSADEQSSAAPVTDAPAAPSVHDTMILPTED